MQRSCGDDDPCTDDLCDSATGCLHPPNDAPCEDGNACTEADRCRHGTCVGGPAPDCDDGNVCTTDTCDPATGCVHSNNTETCAEATCVDNVYYAPATCAAGSCPEQEATDCARGLACVTDSCDPATGCSHVLEPGYCLIGDECYGEGQVAPTDPCRVCRTSLTSTEWSLAEDGTPCGAGRACLAGVCRGPLITEFMALNHDTIEDEDGDSSDWIEIYNPTGVPLSLEGYHLTDDPGDPARWTFPAVEIPPNAYLVVFASGKDRKDPSGWLHTNFKLDADGEYLALASPDLDSVQAFGDVPPQAPDVSYGVALSVTRASFVTTGAAARTHVPAGTSPPEDWAEVAFDDSGEGWSSGVTGIGFDVSPGNDPPASGEELGTPVADSVADWSITGTQGANGWTYGYYNRTFDPDHVYSADAFIPFPRDGSGFGPTDFWDGSVYDWYQGDPPWTTLGPEVVHPNGSNNGEEHWAIRRYVAEVAGPLAVQWHVARGNQSGNGVTGYVFHQGTLVDSVSVAGADTVGVTRMLVLPDVEVGDAVDFALGPEGPQGQPDDCCDASILTAAMWPLPDLKKEIATDVGAAMAGLSPSLYVRVAFDTGGFPGPVNRLFLRMKYDDGFAAWLNGKPIASAHAPQTTSWDATATAKRPLAAAVAFEVFDIRDHLDLLAAGGNVLAIHGLNAAVDDPTFLVLPELEGRHVDYDTGSVRYYGKPTPGADNDDGPESTGPIVQHLTPTGAAPPGQDIVVTVRLFPAAAEVAGATLVYRIMFGPEVSIPMTGGVDNVFTAAIPAGTATAGQMVRWYILARDVIGNESRAPPFDDPLDSEQYFGTIVEDPTVVSNLPVLHWFVEDPAAAATWTGTRCSVFFAGEFYDNVRFDLHGQSTSGFPKKSYDVDFPSDHRFRLSTDYKRMKDINLLTNYADKSKVRNTLAYETFRDAGTGYHLAFPVRVQRNGAFYSVHDFVEDGDDRWLERLGLDPEGALYKQYDGLYDAANGEKKTRKYEDYSDLAAFIASLDQTGEALRNFLYDHVNLPAMANFYAALTITSDADCCHKNFYAYRDTNGSGEWWYLPWDVDLTFGHNWTKTHNYFDETVYAENPLFCGGGNKLTAALYALPEFREMYVRRVRSLMDRLQQPPGTPVEDLKFEKRIDEIVALIGADGAADDAAWPKWGLDQTMEQAAEVIKTDYMVRRRVFLYETKTADGTIPPAQDNPVVLFGEADPSPENPDESWVSLLNPNAFAVDISGWQVQGEISFVFKPGTVLPAGGVAYLCRNLVAFRARALPPTGGQGLFVLGNFSGVLDHPETLVLLDENGVPVPQTPPGM